MLLFALTTDRCRLAANPAPGIPIFFDESGVIRPPSDFMIYLVYQRRRPLTTARTYAMHLQKFLKHLKARGVPWDEVTDRVLIDWREKLLKREGLSSATVAAYLRTVFRLYLWAEETGRLTDAVAIYGTDEAVSGSARRRHFRISAEEGSRRGSFHWPYVPKVHPSPPRHTPVNEEIEALHAASFVTLTGQRDTLILSYYEECYLRRAELLSLVVDDIPGWDAIDEALGAGAGFTISVLGKGGDMRRVAVPAELMGRTREHLERDRADVVARAKRRDPRYREPAELFLSSTTGGVLTPDHLSRRLSGLMRSVGIENASGHRLRATGLTTLVLAHDGVDTTGRPLPARQVLIKVAEIAGHRHVQSLEPYLDLARASQFGSPTPDELRDTTSVRTLRREITALKAKLSALESPPGMDAADG